jgi:hypothetical protein
VPTKTLTIKFNGISTLYPPPPRNGEPDPEKAFVLMAANDRKNNDWNAVLPDHFPFIFVPVSMIKAPIPKPDRSVTDDDLGECNVYFFNNGRVTIDPGSSEAVVYHRDESLELGERPGSDDVAREDDIRWVADFRDIVLDHSPQFRNTAVPSAPEIGKEVAAIVELPGGTLKASFPCKSVQPKTFKAAAGKPAIAGFKRVLASEFLIEALYPEDTATVTLTVAPLRGDSRPIGLDKLTLQWPGNDPMVVRMGNDTEPEALLAASLMRCDGRRENNNPLAIARDDDFDLHYNLLDLPANADRPVPQAGPHQSSGDGCKPGT